MILHHIATLAYITSSSLVSQKNLIEKANINKTLQMKR